MINQLRGLQLEYLQVGLTDKYITSVLINHFQFLNSKLILQVFWRPYPSKNTSVKWLYKLFGTFFVEF